MPHGLTFEAGAVRLLLPVTTRPKRPLVGFDLDVDDARAHLPLRRTLAELQAGYLLHVLARSSAAEDVSRLITADILRAVCGFTPGVVSGFRQLGEARRLAAYLRSLLRCDVSTQAVRRWLHRLEVPAGSLAAALEEPRDAHSASENVLLAVPFMGQRPTSEAQIDKLVERYAAGLDIAQRAGDARDFVVALAEYGRRWELIAEAVVPIDEPFLTKVHEDRPLGLVLGGHCRQRLWCGDAASYHMEARARDPAVIFEAEASTHDPLGRQVGFGVWEGRRLTHDAIALYTSDIDRPLVVDITMRLRVAALVQLPAALTAVLALLACVAVLMLPLGRERVGTLAFLTVPVSLIVAFLVVREQTSLATRLQRGSHTVLLAEVFALWWASIHRLATG